MLDQIQTNLVTAVLIVRIKQREFCFDMNDIQTIINPFRLQTAIKDKNIKMINYDSMDIPIIDFASIFSLESGDGMNTRILVLKRNNQSIGFFVDEVKELITFNYNNSEKINLFPEVNENPYLVGNVYFKDKLFLFPDLNQLFKDYQPQ